MSVSQILPENSRPIKTANSFTATFNNPTVNKYDFGVPANTDVLMLELRPFCIYFLERVNFSIDIEEGAFHQGYDSLANVVKASIKYGSKKEMVYGSPIPFFNYLTNFSIHQWAGGTGNKTETLTLDFSGVLKQVADMNQAETITAFLSWSIYQVKDNEWVQAFQNGNLWRLTGGLGKYKSREIAGE